MFVVSLGQGLTRRREDAKVAHAFPWRLGVSSSSNYWVKGSRKGAKTQRPEDAFARRHGVRSSVLACGIRPIIGARADAKARRKIERRRSIDTRRRSMDGDADAHAARLDHAAWGEVVEKISRWGNARGITKTRGGRSGCRRTNACRRERRRIARSRRYQRARWNQRPKCRTLSSQASPTIRSRSRIGCKSLGMTLRCEDPEAGAHLAPSPVEEFQVGGQ